MPKISSDWKPEQHAYQTMYKWVWIQEKNAHQPFSEEKDIQAFCDAENEAFMLYWLDTKKAKKSWSMAWLNWMRRNWENARHRRSDSGSMGFNAFSQLTEQDKPKPVQRLKYKIPEREPVESMSFEEAMKQLRR